MNRDGVFQVSHMDINFKRLIQNQSQNGLCLPHYQLIDVTKNDQWTAMTSSFSIDQGSKSRQKS